MDLIGIFGVRHDSSRGILIETVEATNLSVYFFKYNDQPLASPLARHCEQIQSIVRKANVKRAKKIRVDMSEFIHEYYNTLTRTVEFKGTKLNSSEQQIVFSNSSKDEKCLNSLNSFDVILVS